MKYSAVLLALFLMVPASFADYNDLQANFLNAAVDSKNAAVNFHTLYTSHRHDPSVVREMCRLHLLPLKSYMEQYAENYKTCVELENFAESTCSLFSGFRLC